MVVGLGQGCAVAGEDRSTFAVAVEDSLVTLGGVRLHPRKQSGAEVKTDSRITVNNLSDLKLRIENPRRAVRQIALPGDALIPVVMRTGRILSFDSFQPGVFARRLIKMAMNAGKTLHVLHSTAPRADSYDDL